MDANSIGKAAIGMTCTAHIGDTIGGSSSGPEQVELKGRPIPAWDSRHSLGERNCLLDQGPKYSTEYGGKDDCVWGTWG